MNVHCVILGVGVGNENNEKELTLQINFKLGNCLRF
jgi:hypothetical protein